MLAKAFRCRTVLQMILQADTGTAEQHSCHFCNTVSGEHRTKQVTMLSYSIRTAAMADLKSLQQSNRRLSTGEER